MKSFGFASVTAGAAAVLFAGCAGSPSPPGAFSAASENGAITTDHGTSWMRRDATQLNALLYISDGGTSSVFVYDFSTGSLVGTLTGFNRPLGQCVDKTGDVWITNYAPPNSTIVEYAHGGSTPIATLAVNGDTYGCSIDPKTGNLAVSSTGFDSGGNGELQIFAPGSDTPKVYPAPATCPNLWPPGYDNHGNLYVEGYYRASESAICELPEGGKALRSVPFDHTIEFPSSVMWDGKYITLGDQNYFKRNGWETTAIYQAVATRSGSLMSVGVTVLTNACRRHRGLDLPFPFIVGRSNTPNTHKQGSLVIGQDYPCRRRSSDFAFWHYPLGGDHFKALASPPINPLGQSVSFLAGAEK